MPLAVCFSGLFLNVKDSEKTEVLYWKHQTLGVMRACWWQSIHSFSLISNFLFVFLTGRQYSRFSAGGNLSSAA